MSLLTRYRNIINSFGKGAKRDIQRSFDPTDDDLVRFPEIH